MGEKPWKGCEGHGEVREVDAVTMVMGWFSRRQSWSPGQTRGIRRHCPQEAFPLTYSCEASRVSLKAFASGVAVAEAAADGLMPPKAGKCSESSAWPTPSRSYSPSKNAHCLSTWRGGEQGP